MISLTSAKKDVTYDYSLAPALALARKMDRNGQWTEMDLNGPEWTEMDNRLGLGLWTR